VDSRHTGSDYRFDHGGNPITQRTPWYNQTDFNLQQNYKISEKKTLAFSATIGNVLNERSVTSVEGISTAAIAITTSRQAVASLRVPLVLSAVPVRVHLTTRQLPSVQYSDPDERGTKRAPLHGAQWHVHHGQYYSAPQYLRSADGEQRIRPAKSLSTRPDHPPGVRFTF